VHAIVNLTGISGSLRFQEKSPLQDLNLKDVTDFCYADI
jgi:hypothetical protein